MGLSVRIFRNFRDFFQTVRTEFRDCFRTVRVEFSGLFSDSPDKTFETVFGQSGTEFRLSFNPETNVFEFCGVFWYYGNSMTNREGTKRYHVLYGFEIWVILCVIVGKINIMLYVKIMLIYTCLTY